MSGDRGTHAERNSGACSTEKDAAIGNWTAARKQNGGQNSRRFGVPYQLRLLSSQRARISYIFQTGLLSG